MALFAEFNPAPVFRFDSMGTVLVSNTAANYFFSKESIEGKDVHVLIKEFVRQWKDYTILVHYLRKMFNYLVSISDT